MVKAGIAGSLMSLGAVDFGLVVDGSVVMVENSMRHLGHRKEGQSFMHAVLESCAEVARPILFGVGIIIVVYLPILTLEGVEGKKKILGLNAAKLYGIDVPKEYQLTEGEPAARDDAELVSGGSPSA